VNSLRLQEYLVQMTFTLYIIFHKFLVPEAYETLSPADLSHLRFFAVNAKIPKKIPEHLKANVIEERKLPWYNPFLQHNRFCESSAFFHLWKNPHLITTEYIGFFHYDMLITEATIRFLETEIRGPDPILFTNVCLPAAPQLCQIIHIDAWGGFVSAYNTMFDTRHTIADVMKEDLPLYHSFVVHRETFNKMMTYAEKVIPYLFEAIGFDTTHLPFMIERLHGIFLTLQRLEGRVKQMSLPGVTHVDALKDHWRGAY
jgi:hypothetical protein